jgi:hypothetical protein
MTKKRKTETIQERPVYVYLKSEMVEDWKRRAKRCGVSVSKFVVEQVEERGLEERAR